MFKVLSVLVIIAILATTGAVAFALPEATCENTGDPETVGNTVAYVVLTTSGNGVKRVNCWYYPWAFNGTTPASITAWCDSINNDPTYEFVLGFRFTEGEWLDYIKCRYIYNG